MCDPTSAEPEGLCRNLEETPGDFYLSPRTSPRQVISFCGRAPGFGIPIVVQLEISGSGPVSYLSPIVSPSSALLRCIAPNGPYSAMREYSHSHSDMDLRSLQPACHLTMPSGEAAAHVTSNGVCPSAHARAEVVPLRQRTSDAKVRPFDPDPTMSS